MLRFKKSLITGLIAAGIGLTSLSSFAQMPPPAPGADGQGQPPSTERQAKHEAKLHDLLKITAAQEAAWNTFISKTAPMRPEAAPARLSKEERSNLTTPQMLDHQQELMSKHQEWMTQRIAATKEFYAVLSPAQQKVFDEELRKMERRHLQHESAGKRGHGNAPADAPPPPPAN